MLVRTCMSMKRVSVEGVGKENEDLCLARSGEGEPRPFSERG